MPSLDALNDAKIAAGLTRDVAKTAEAIAVVGKEEVERRGGVNRQGYFMDVPVSQQLSAEEYKRVTLPNGTIDTLAALDILNKKSGASTMGGTTGAGTNAATTAANSEALAKRQSAFDLLREQFAQYGLEALVDPLQRINPRECISIRVCNVRLRQTEPYKKRFAANAARIGKGLRALSEAEYTLHLEDSVTKILCVTMDYQHLITLKVI
jgi:hypothetical protein